MKKNFYHTYRLPIQLSFMLIAIVYSLSFVFLGSGNAMDEYYWISQYTNYSSSFMTCFTLWLGNLWAKFMGDYVLGFKLLNWLCCIVALLLPYFALQTKEVAFQQLYYISLGLFLLGYGCYSEFSPGTITILLFSGVLTCVIKFMHLKKYVYLCMAACFAGLSFAARFPNILLLGVVPLVLLFNENALGKSFRCNIKAIFLFVFISVIVYATTLLLLLDISSVFSSGVHAVQSSATGAHSIGNMMRGLYSDGIVVMKYMGLILLFGYVLKMGTYSISSWCKWLIFIVGTLLVLYVYVMGVGFHKWYNFQMHYLEAAFLFVLIMSIVRTMAENKSYDEIRDLVLIFLVCLVVPMGSDTKWMKLFPLCVCVMPYIFSRYLRWRNEFRCYLPAISLVVLAIIMTFSGNSIEQKPLWHNVCKVDNPKFSGILVDEQFRCQVEDFENLSEKYLAEGRLGHVIGTGAYLFSYSTSCPIGETNCFWPDYNSPSFVSTVLSQSSVDDVLFVFSDEEFSMRGTLLERHLLDQFDFAEDANGILVFVKNSCRL